MPNAFVQLLRAHRDHVIDLLATRVLQTVPRYTLVAAPELHANVEALFDELLQVIETSDRGRLSEQLGTYARRRIGQGFAPSDYLRALLTTGPVFRALARELAPTDDPDFAASVEAVETEVAEAVAIAANVYTDSVARQLESKNTELNRLNQRLQLQERVLSQEIDESSRALASANEFNRRVIESLTSGVMVIDARNLHVSLYSSRLEEILELPAEQVLGRPFTEALAPVGGLDVERWIEEVRALGRLPFTRVRLVLPNGRSRSVHARAHRLHDPEGRPEGTVVVVDDVSERELLIDSFSRYVSRDVVQRLLARGENPALEGERRDCTVLFADVRGFTRLAEDLPPEELHALLNIYLRVMIEAISAHGGFIDKFVGDKVMAIFDAGGRAATSAAAGISSARDILLRIREINAERERGGRPPIEVGIGVNSGEVLLGNVGSEERMEFTAIGDTVNVADRLQAMARGGEVLVGGRTAALVAPRFDLEDRGESVLRGRARPTRTFALPVG